ncbi:hypothetical protein ES705_08424 [subsurface metagenome]
MGDKHVCSSCSENLEGKQHIKIVFENWPQEKVTTYRRKGKEYRRKTAIIKELITALCMNCVGNPDKWVNVKELEEPELTPFFNYLAKMGKNPLFKALLVKNGPLCIVADCKHRTAPNCAHLLRSHSAQFSNFDELSCEVGHPGATLVHRGKDEVDGNLKKVLGSSYFGTFRNLIPLFWQEQHGLFTKIYFTLFYSFPMSLALLLYSLAAYPFWWGLKLKNSLSLGGLK